MLVRGEPARLFPILADTSKEGRTLSIFLACLETVPELARVLLGELGVRVGTRADIKCFTEVAFKKAADGQAFRPDGLITVYTGRSTWTALVEAKVGNSELTAPQLEAYLEIAKANGVDALITLSNQFASLPAHHPVPLSAVARKKAKVFHWSWMYVLTHSTLISANDGVTDREQRVILRELNRFLLHPSSGVKGYDQMPAAWSEVVAKVAAGGAASASSTENRQVVEAWHQEVGDLSLVLSRQLLTNVRVRLDKAHVQDPALRLRDDQKQLAAEGVLATSLSVPNAAAPIDVCVDLRKRSITTLMALRAPDTPTSAKARVNWLLKQLPDDDAKDLHIRCRWPGRSDPTQFPLEKVRKDPEILIRERGGQVLYGFELLLVRDLGAKLSQRKLFLAELETVIPSFYARVAQHVKAWQPKPPRLTDARGAPTDVSTDAMRDEVEKEALAGEA